MLTHYSECFHRIENMSPTHRDKRRIARSRRLARRDSPLVARIVDALLDDLQTRFGITEYDIERDIGLPQATTYRIRTGKVDDPRTATMKRMAGYFSRFYGRITTTQLRGDDQLPPAAQEAVNRFMIGLERMDADTHTVLSPQHPDASRDQDRESAKQTKAWRTTDQQEGEQEEGQEGEQEEGQLAAVSKALSKLFERASSADHEHIQSAVWHFIAALQDLGLVVRNQPPDSGNVSGELRSRPRKPRIDQEPPDSNHNFGRQEKRRGKHSSRMGH